MQNIKLTVVVPCYNEEAVLPETVKRLGAFLTENSDLLSPESKVLFVDDGSRDATWRLICEFADQDARFSGVQLSRNRGHQNALWAGMEEARGKCDCLISIDADLQDDVGAMRRFLEEYAAGADVVYGVRSRRDTDSAFKRLTAEGFYKLMGWLGAETVYNHADYRLLSARALDALLENREVNLYIRGLVPLVGFNTATVYYERSERFAGESKYPLRKMLALAFEGAASFSVKPLSFIWKTGALIALIACLVGFIYLIVPARGPGFGVFSVWFMGGLILIALGLVGEYIGKMYAEVKHRPRYFIKDRKNR